MNIVRVRSAVLGGNLRSALAKMSAARVTLSSMSKVGMRGEVNALLIPLILVTLLLFGSLGFGFWAFSGRQNYKNNVDQIVASKIQQSNQQLTNQLNAQFAQKYKFPLKTYSGPEAFGSLAVEYPKTWSSYVAVDNQNDTPVDGYFYPGTVPDITNQSNSFALRVQVLQQAPSDFLAQYSDNVAEGTVKVRPYSLPKVPKVVGNYMTGQIQDQKQGEMVVFPLRNETLVLWTESQSFENDFNNIILKNFTFSP